MTSQTANRPVLITGCSSGIGYHVAHALARQGYPVYASARQGDDVERLNQEGLRAVQLDLADSESISRALDTVLEQSGGRLYGLFNNGAYGQPGAVEDLSREVLCQQFQTNVFGWHELTRRVIPVMRRQGYGRIIQNSSVLGLIALKFRGAYNASKYAIEGLSDTLRLELEGSGVYVSLIEPGPITSQFRANALHYYQQNIRPEQSHFHETYRSLEERLAKEGAAVPFTLGPEAVLKRVIHALQSKRPKPRYYVTFPTYLFGYLKRILSARAMDRLLQRID